ncbi:MAG TPA: type III-B CRISPR module RAMP protein Cmr1 [Planctomycetaceae bacterium]|nr:type III-B CRISPR module RAMP protein Cmr1 [Planctomycetaceae bacterium]HIQ19854.1 type III-B CRISPR module RAMP protein Cmr1 [Planctomycetota bacterium]
MDGVPEIRLPLEAVTPVWMAGAGRRAEVRAPTVRGCLRFWLRALLGGPFVEDLKTLAAAEAAGFRKHNSLFARGRAVDWRA